VVQSPYIELWVSALSLDRSLTKRIGVVEVSEIYIFPAEEVKLARGLYIFEKAWNVLSLSFASCSARLDPAMIPV
jgi:hypothetical protein